MMLSASAESMAILQRYLCCNPFSNRSHVSPPSRLSRSPPDALKTDGGAAANRTMRKGCDPLKAGLAPGAGAWSRCIR
jgi:hypothetical protein